MHLLRCLHFLSAIHDIRISATHIVGVDNTAADAISRNNINQFFCFLPKGFPTANQGGTAALEHSGGGSTRLAVRRLEEQAQQFLQAGIATSTEKAYTSAQRSYLFFCSQLNVTPLPASEDTLILYIADLAQSKAHSTIKTYLAVVRYLHVINGLGNPLDGKLRFKKELIVLKGINRLKPRANCPWLPITPVIMVNIKS